MGSLVEINGKTNRVLIIIWRVIDITGPCVLWFYFVDFSFADSSFAKWRVIDVTGLCVLWLYFVDSSFADSSFAEENQSTQGPVTAITRQNIINTWLFPIYFILQNKY